MPMKEANIQETAHERPQIRRGGLRVPDRPANDLTCNESDVDELLSAGELT
jgi:hypothetical protein